MSKGINGEEFNKNYAKLDKMYKKIKLTWLEFICLLNIFSQQIIEVQKIVKDENEN